MRELHVDTLRDTVARLCIEANYYLPEDVVAALERALGQEESPRGRQVLELLLRNATAARQEQMPLCQDCGTTVVMLEVGQEVHLVGGDVHEAIAEGVRRGYKEGFLRSSMALRPFTARLNTGDNTPPVIHTELVAGDSLRIRVMPKGGGCENMSRFAVLLPSAGKQGLRDFVVKAVEEAGGNPCPPIIVGVGIGGTSEKAMLLAKEALFRQVGQPSPDPEAAALEQELLEAVNATGIGPQAWGGRITALAVHVESYPTHITALPVAVNLQCHSARWKEAVL